MSDSGPFTLFVLEDVESCLVTERACTCLIFFIYIRDPTAERRIGARSRSLASAHTNHYMFIRN